MNSLEAFVLGIQLFFAALMLGDHFGARERILVEPCVSEDAEQRIVIFCGNGIELMIVTLRAGDGNGKHSAAQRIDAIVLLLGLSEKNPRPPISFSLFLLSIRSPAICALRNVS